MIGDKFAPATALDPGLGTIYDLLHSPAAIESIDNDEVSDLVAAEGRSLSSVRVAAPVPRPVAEQNRAGRRFGSLLVDVRYL